MLLATREKTAQHLCMGQALVLGSATQGMFLGLLLIPCVPMNEVYHLFKAQFPHQ